PGQFERCRCAGPFNKPLKGTASHYGGRRSFKHCLLTNCYEIHIVMNELIEDKIKQFYSLLLRKQYREIEKLTQGNNLSAEAIENAISEYECTLVPYPINVAFDIIEISSSKPKSWSVVAPIYSSEEGFSDLSIELTIIQTTNGHIYVELDNIHVR
ncbi:DUF7668 domain-containing protein, partial [Desulfoluna butyratoxydans]|uniref:DUF7668 domain-containing protein n=1 Tax=Desulfoluna butyratoxydans TaxID=231438 RepID=UPI001C550F6E